MKSMSLLLFVFILSGCASALDRKARLDYVLAVPVDCTQVDNQIEQLEAEKVQVGEQVANGIASILPTSVIYNLVVGELGSRWTLANGEHNRVIDERITHLQSACTQMAMTTTK